MRIAITGGSGEFGSIVTTEALKLGHDVVSIDRSIPTGAAAVDGLCYIQADLCDYNQTVAALAGCDALIHLAAIAAPGLCADHIVHNNNVTSSYNVLRAAVENGILRICQASSVNAIGFTYSRAPHFDYFPIDEEHPNYSEDPYSLSKWICEQQADSFARRYEAIQIASMRLHWIVENRSIAAKNFNPDIKNIAKNLWGYSRADTSAHACLLSLDASLHGHEVFYIVGSDSTEDVSSRELAAKYFPDVPIKSDFEGNCSFFSSEKAHRMLGWQP